MTDDQRPVRVARMKAGATILVCGKCLKRCPGRKILRDALKDALAGRRGTGGARKPKLLRTSCLGLCPKRALVLASGATLAVNEVVLLEAASEASAAIDRLLPDPEPGLDPARGTGRRPPGPVRL